MLPHLDIKFRRSDDEDKKNENITVRKKWGHKFSKLRT